MNNFEILARFLERFGDDVEGRSLEELPAETRMKLSDFAKGALPADQRKEIASLLKQNPGWISVLAEEAKAARGPAGA